MYSVQFRDSLSSKQLVLSVVHDAGYALILPWMVIPVSQIVLTQVVSGSSTVVARAAIGREIPDLKHLALTVDGTTVKVYFRGRLLTVGTLSTTMTIDRVELQGGTKDTLLSEMLLMPRVAEPEDIKTWWNLRAPFYDPSPVVYKDQIPYAGDWDSKNKTYYDPDPPTGASVGDLWVDTDDNDRLYRWDGATWVDITDKSPVDAEKKPVYVKGAGADIDIDKFGIRATRKADGKKTFEIDAETGDVHFEGDGVFRGRVEAEEGYFRGDITGASGTFSGHLSAERIIEGIEVYGGLTADHIKAGTITADRLNMPTVRLNIPSVTLDHQQKTSAAINLPDITFVGVPMIGSNMEVPQFPGVGESNAIEVRDSGGENSGRAYIEMFSKNAVVLVLKNESPFGGTRSYGHGSAFIELTYMEN